MFLEQPLALSGSAKKTFNILLVFSLRFQDFRHILKNPKPKEKKKKKSSSPIPPKKSEALFIEKFI